MKSVDELGIFWLANDEDDVLSGRLTFDPTGSGADLKLVGVFDGQNRSSDRPPCRIYGWIGNDQVTLDSVYSRGIGITAPGPERSEYFANRLFIGAHLAPQGTLRFDSVSMVIDDLNSWRGYGGLSRSFECEGVKIQFVPLADESANFTRGLIEVAQDWKAPEGRGFVEIREWPILRISYKSSHTLEEIQSDVSLIETLLTLCLDSTLQLDEFVLTKAATKHIMLDGTVSNREMPIELLAPRVNYVQPKDRRKRSRMLLTFDDAGGVATLAKWLDVSSKYSRAINSMMSIHRAKQMFGENRFMNVTYAAEALHRVLIGGGQRMSTAEYQALLDVLVVNTPEDHREWIRSKLLYTNEPSLGKRLNQLVAMGGDAALSIVGNKRRWANTIAAVRNELTHLGSNDALANGRHLYWLTESVFSIVRLCLLIEAGVPASVLQETASDSSVFWFGDRLQASIDAVRQNIRTRDVD